MTDLDKAREWANGGEHLVGFLHPDAKAAIEIIQSLPDKWVDVEKVREIVEPFMNSYEGNPREAIQAVIELITPKRPTLADMTQEEREACQWMQCEIDGQIAGILARVDEQRGHIWIDSGYSLGWKLENITPLPDLPKLQWPGNGPIDLPVLVEDERIESWHEIARHKFFSDCYRDGVLIDHMIKKLDEVVDAEIVEDQETTDSSSIHTPMQPSEVPPNEPWLLEIDGNQCIGTRLSIAIARPWSVAALNGSHAFHVDDSEITLIHKLVPETHALPEGMRLADHETLGRIVVSQRADEDGDYAFFESIPGGIAGASWGYVNESELTFLGGDQHV